MQSLTDEERKLWFGYKEASGLKVSPGKQYVDFSIYKQGNYTKSYTSRNSIGLMSDTFTLKKAISAPNTFSVAGSIITPVVTFDAIKGSTLDVALKDLVYDEPFKSYINIRWYVGFYSSDIALGYYYLNSRAINDKVVSYEFYARSSKLDTFTVSSKRLSGVPLITALRAAAGGAPKHFSLNAENLPESLQQAILPSISEDYVFTARQALQFLGEYYGLVYKVDTYMISVSRLKPNIEHDRFPHAEIFKTSFEYEDAVSVDGTRIYYDSALFYEEKSTGTGPKIMFPYVVKDNPLVFDEATASQCSGYRNIGAIDTKVGYVEHWSCPALEPGDLFVLDDNETSFMFVTEIVYRLNGLMTIRTSMDLAGVQNDILTYNNTNANKTPPSSTSSTTSASTLSFGTTSLRATTSLNSYVEDCGEGVLDDEGTLYIDLNPVFSEVVDVSSYLVFLQQYGDGSLYVSSKEDYHFVVKGTPGLRFAWCVKGLRKSTDSETR